MRVQFGDVTFDSETRELTRRGELQHLSPKAFQLLQILLEKRPKAVSKEELIERIWPDVFVEDANLKNLVVEIRRILGDESHLRTIRGFGYAFSGVASTQDEKATAKLVTRDRNYPLRIGDNIIGRADDCAVVLDAVGVSRHHARVVVSDSGTAHLEDLGSKNGTWLNEVQVTESTELKSGDQIVIGTQALTYRPVSREETTTATVDSVRRGRQP